MYSIYQELQDKPRKLNNKYLPVFKNFIKNNEMIKYKIKAIFVSFEFLIIRKFIIANNKFLLKCLSES